MRVNPATLRKAVELRHALHAHPERSNQERWTKAFLMDFLKENTAHLELVDMGQWFYAAYRAGADRPGIAFRADFDAIPVADEIPAPYVSQVPGMGHKCGHDGHSASLAALALEVDRRGADQNAFFLFQHAEETGDGALACTRLLRRERVDEIFGFHNRPGVPLGTVQVRDGTVYCGSQGLILRFQGVPSHASMPELGRNPAYAIAELILGLEELRTAQACRGLVLATVIQVNVGERAFGVQASTGELLLTIRGEYEEELRQFRDSLEARAKERAQHYGLTLEIRSCDVFPNTVSHRGSNEKVRAACRKLGIPLRELPAPHRSSEDFGHYTRLIPGAFFEIGSGENCPDLHTVGFDFPDGILETAVKLGLALLDGP